MSKKLSNYPAIIDKEKAAHTGSCYPDRPVNTQHRLENQRLPLINPRVRSVTSTPSRPSKANEMGFVTVVFEMINHLSKSEPDLVGWGDDGQHFYVSNKKYLARVCKAMKPFFAHGNFSSFRRQLSTYNFIRRPTGRYQGYWYHPRFHQSSSEEDLRYLQSNRRRRDQASHRCTKSIKSSNHSVRFECSGNIKPLSEGDCIDFSETEGVQTLVFEPMAQLFPLSCLMKDEILTNSIVATDSEDTSKQIVSHKGTEMKCIEFQSISSFITCTPIKPKTLKFPLLHTAANMRSREGAVRCLNTCGGLNHKKVNSLDTVEQSNPYQLPTDKFSPINYQSPRSPPFVYDCEITQLLCSPNRQHSSSMLAENRKPILFSFRGGKPLVKTTSPTALRHSQTPVRFDTKSDQADSQSDAIQLV